ncbi:MAG TPA: DEAD/DEAH box helicase [Firmicutes bacterium]|nr:DEAD/DEAH box helicase [Bacillota bacterium]
MVYNSSNPLIVQSDRTLLLEAINPLFEQARDEIALFSELEKSPEYVHTYRITPLSLWNAAASGLTAEAIIASLRRYTKFEIPEGLIRYIVDYTERYGRVLIEPFDSSHIILKAQDELIAAEIWNDRNVRQYISDRQDEVSFLVPLGERGRIKQALVKIGYPAKDLAGYVSGAPLDFRLKEFDSLGVPFRLRDYQRQAVDAFYAEGSAEGGSGVVVLPCGAGKTMVALGVMEKLRCHTLVLTTGVTAARQWIKELLDKTNLSPDLIGEYNGEKKLLRPVTIATYNILVHRKRKTDDYPHFSLFNGSDWGLIVYDEVHLLPAPVFRITAEIQARRRLGLTATLVREDGREEEVFTLIGPKKYDVPWKVLERQRWIARAECLEIRVELVQDMRLAYAVSDEREKFRIASENPNKLPVIMELLRRHASDHVLIIGQYINQLRDIARMISAPIITGDTPNHERERLYAQFRNGSLSRLVVSKVANFSVDLPDANVAIQVSGTFGSRQEEAQRLGRVLRPKPGDNVAYFYSLVTKDSREQFFAANRQLFLTEQGYRYRIVNSDAVPVLGRG